MYALDVAGDDGCCDEVEGSAASPARSACFQGTARLQGVPSVATCLAPGHSKLAYAARSFGMGLRIDIDIGAGTGIDSGAVRRLRF